ncbi:MAG: hypothetical protein ACTHMM_05505 [Agriterribacter sp.]
MSTKLNDNGQKHFRNTVLQRIFRTYSKDEALAVLISELKDAKFKLGELISENAELQHTIQQLRADARLPKIQLSKEDQLDARIVELNQRLGKRGEALGKVKKEVTLWRDRYIALKMKIDNK